MSSEKNELRKLAEVQKMFTDWRLKRKGRETIPDHLWQTAMDLLSEFTLTKVAKALRLNGTELKMRATQAGICEPKEVKKKRKATSSRSKGAASTFVEVLIGDGKNDDRRDGKPDRGWRIQVRRKDGAQMEITPPPGFGDYGVQALVLAFLGG